MSSNRERALESATEIVGQAGLRALTHRAVDARAGLPPGTTSNYFRTRAALLQGVVELMGTVELPRVAGAEPPQTAEELEDRLVGIYGFLSGPSRVRTAARLALFVESGHDESLRDALRRGRARFEEVLRAWFVGLAASDPALSTQIVAVAIEGLLLHEIGGYAEVDAPPVIRAAVKSALAAR